MDDKKILEIYKEWFRKLLNDFPLNDVSESFVKEEIVKLIKLANIPTVLCVTDLLKFLIKGETSDFAMGELSEESEDITNFLIIDLTSLYFLGLHKDLVKKHEDTVIVPVTPIILEGTEFGISPNFLQNIKNVLYKTPETVEKLDLREIDPEDKESLVVGILGGAYNILSGRSWDDFKEENSEEASEEYDEEIERIIEEHYSQAILGSVSYMLLKYQYLFESGFDLIPTEGFIRKTKNVGATCISKPIEIKEGLFRLDVVDNSGKNYTDSVISFLGSILNPKLSKILFNDCRTSDEIVKNIIAGYKLSSKACYCFINKLIEYAYGFKSIEESSVNDVDLFEKLEDSISGTWDSMAKYIKEDLTNILKKYVYVSLLKVLDAKKEGLLEQDKDPILYLRTDECTDDIIDSIEFFKESLTRVCVVKKYLRDKDGVIAEFQCMSSLPTKEEFDTVRVGSTGNAELRRDEIIKKMIRKCFGGMSGAVVDGKVTGQPTSDLTNAELNIFEIGYVYNSQIANGMPRFALKALDRIKAKGQKPTFDNTLLGLSEKGTILTASSDEIKLTNKLLHFVCAGSRAGKGVMTLNLLTFQLYSGIPIFYLDDKPDMAQLFHTLSKDMVVVNGGTVNPTFEGEDHFFTNRMNNLVNRREYIPDCAITALTLKDQMSDPETAFRNLINPDGGLLGDIIYLKTFLLVFGLCIDACSTNAKKMYEAFKQKGQERGLDLDIAKTGLTLVLDEVSTLQRSLLNFSNSIAEKIPNTKMDTNLKNLQANIRKFEQQTEEYINSEDSKKGKKKEPNPVDLTSFTDTYSEANLYALGLFNLLKMSLSTLKTLNQQGMLNPLPKNINVFVIGQDMEPKPLNESDFSEEVKVKTTNGVGLNSAANLKKSDFSVFMGLLTNFSSGNAFYGFKGMVGSPPDFLAQSNPKSRANGQLDKIAMKFAFVPKYDLNNMLELQNDSPKNLEVANDSNTVYFKPFLIFNNIGKKVDESKARIEDLGLSWEDVINENKYIESKDKRPERTFKTSKEDKDDYVAEPRLDVRVGFKEYLYGMGLTDEGISNSLGKSGEILNILVEEGFGYTDGDWWDFVTDFRPEWQYSLKDVRNAAHNMNKGPLEDNVIAFSAFNKIKNFISEQSEKISSGQEDEAYAQVYGTSRSDIEIKHTKQKQEALSESLSNSDNIQKTEGDIFTGQKPLLSLKEKTPVITLKEKGEKSSGGLFSGIRGRKKDKKEVISKENEDVGVGSRYTPSMQGDSMQGDSMQGDSMQESREKLLESLIQEDTREGMAPIVESDTRGGSLSDFGDSNNSSFSNKKQEIERKINPAVISAIQEKVNVPVDVEKLSEEDLQSFMRLLNITGDLYIDVPVETQSEQESYSESSEKNVENYRREPIEIIEDSKESDPVENTEGVNVNVETEVEVEPEFRQSRSSAEQSERERELEEVVKRSEDLIIKLFKDKYESAHSDVERVAVIREASSVGVDLSSVISIGVTDSQSNQETVVTPMSDEYYDSSYNDQIFPQEDYIVGPVEGIQTTVQSYTPEEEIVGFSKSENVRLWESVERPSYTDDPELRAVASANDIDSVTKFITREVIRFGGGPSAITMFVQQAEIFHLTSGYGTAPKTYNMKLPSSMLTQMDADLAAVLDSACVAEMFDYSALLKMRKLTYMRFDSEILYNYVLPCLGQDNLDVEYFFKQWKNLEKFAIGVYDNGKTGVVIFTRDNYRARMQDPAIRNAYFQNKLLRRWGVAAWEASRDKTAISLRKLDEYRERRRRGGFFNTIESTVGMAIHSGGAVVHEGTSVGAAAAKGMSYGLGKGRGAIKSIGSALKGARKEYKTVEAQRKKLLRQMEDRKRGN